MSLPRLPFEVTERIILLVQDLSLCLELGVGGQATLVKLVEAQYGPGRVLSEALRRKDYKLIQWLASHFRIPPEVALLKCAQSGDETSLQLTFSLYYPSSEPTVHALRVATQLAIRFGRIGVLDALLQRQQLHELMFYGYCRSCLFRPENILDWLMTRWDTIRNYPQLCERMVTCAIWGDRLDVLERLLDADAKFLLDPIDTYHFTGGLTGSEETFRWILRWAARRADSPEVASRSPVLFSAIGHACARLGYSALLKDLLSPPYNVSVYLGMIYSAIVWGNLDTVRTLYNHLVSQDLMQLRTERSTLTLENKFAVTTSFVRNLRSRKPVDEDGFAIIRYVLDKSAGIATAIRDDILKNMILTSSLSNCEEFVLHYGYNPAADLMGPALRRGEREMISWVYTMCPAGQRRKHHYRDILQLDNLLRNGLDYISHLIDLGIITLDEDDCADPRPPVSRWLNYDPLSDLDEALLRPPEDLPSCITTQVLFSQWRRNPSFEPYAAMIDNCSEADITRAIRAVQAELVKSGGYDLEEYLLPSQILDCINGDQNLADCIEHWWDSQEGIFNDFAVIGDLAKVDFILYMHSKRICFDFAGVEVPDSETAQWTYL